MKRKLLSLAAACCLGLGFNTQVQAVEQAYQLPELPYTYDALEPYIDKETMEIHHQKHHQTYLDNLNAVILEHPEVFEGKTIEEVLANIEDIPSEIKKTVVNHGGGYINHNLFWEILSPDGGEPDGKLAKAITKTFGSFENFQSEFNNQMKSLFGSGWVWLIVNAQGDLEIMQTANQDSPYMTGKTPILGIDVWEHAYYLGYQNKRADYIEGIWNLINWGRVEELFKEVKH